MIEVEAKVRLTPADLKQVKQVLKVMTKPGKKVIKTDAYYGDEKAFSIRIREENGKAFFCLKKKNRSRGVEMNQEIDFPLKSGEDFHKWLWKLGIKKTAQKQKQSLVYNYQDFHIELNHVAGLGDYLEIETLVEDPKKVPAAKRQLHDLFKRLGFAPDQFEKKYYLELLQEKEKRVK